jgi:FKBP-type peptidyl-prolyl cis-trans isomerase SlyD
MVIGKDKMVSLIYELRESNSEGKILETVVEKSPLSFVFGTGRLLPEFESNLESLKEGDNFSFKLNQEQAYGERREEMIIDIPKSVFEVDGKIDEKLCIVGNEVPMADSSGNRLNGIVNEVTETIVKMDFNHPMSGIDLYFKGKIVSVRDVTEEELASMNSSCSGCSSHSEESGCGCSGSCS